VGQASTPAAGLRVCDIKVMDWWLSFFGALFLKYVIL